MNDFHKKYCEMHHLYAKNHNTILYPMSSVHRQVSWLQAALIRPLLIGLAREGSMVAALLAAAELKPLPL